MKVTITLNGKLMEAHDIPDNKVLLLLGHLKKYNLDYVVHKTPITIVRNCNEQIE